MFLGKLPEYPKSTIHDVQVDLYCLSELYKIYNGREETELDSKPDKGTDDDNG